LAHNIVGGVMNPYKLPLQSPWKICFLCHTAY